MLCVNWRKSSKERQERVAREFNHLFTIGTPFRDCPVKMGTGRFAFRYLAPDRYKEIATLLNEKRLEREQYIQFVIDKLKMNWLSMILKRKLQVGLNIFIRFIEK
jgi:(p)ppGpp synthase/HD superfamily hydrolase